MHIRHQTSLLLNDIVTQKLLHHNLKLLIGYFPISIHIYLLDYLVPDLLVSKLLANSQDTLDFFSIDAATVILVK